MQAPGFDPAPTTMHELPPETTVGSTKSVGNALAALLPKRGAPVEESAPPANGKTTLGQLRAKSPQRHLGGALSEDGVPEMAWDPATRFADSPAGPRRSLRPSVSPVAGRTPPAATQAASAPAPLQEAAPSIATLMGGALRIGKGL